jgi:glutathione peroxidase-family protein
MLGKFLTNFFERSVKNIDGKKIDFQEFKGKKVFLLVNVASK